MNTPILRVEDFGKRFTLHEQGKVIPSADNVSFEVMPGGLTALVGPTGAGKSSVLKGIYRSYLADRGRILFRTTDGDWLDLVQADEHRILALRRREIGFVTQFLHTLPRQSTEDVVAQPLVAQGRDRSESRNLAREMLAALNLPEHLWGVSPATFSGGEKQRVNLARGFVAAPRLLLLDEPTASLDPTTAERVVNLIEQQKRAGMAMLAIFHQPQLVQRLADQIVELAPPPGFSTDIEDVA